MDSKITKQRLNDHFSYDWMKYFGLIFAVIFLFSLVFTMTAPRLSKGQQLDIFLIGKYYSTEAVSGLSEKLLAVKNPDDLMEINANSYDITDANIVQAYQVRVMAGEGDMILAYYTAMQTSIDNGVIACLSDELAIASTLEPFPETTEGKADFSVYIKKAYREKDVDKLLADLRAENARRAHYKANAEKLLDYVEQYPELKMNYARGSYHNSVIGDDGEKMALESEKFWAIDFKLLIAKMNSLIYYTPLESAQTDEQKAAREFEFAMGIMSYKSANQPYFYETLSVLNYFIDTYLTVPVNQ